MLRTYTHPHRQWIMKHGADYWPPLSLINYGPVRNAPKGGGANHKKVKVGFRFPTRTHKHTTLMTRKSSMLFVSRNIWKQKKKHASVAMHEWRSTLTLQSSNVQQFWYTNTPFQWKRWVCSDPKTVFTYYFNQIQNQTIQSGRLRTEWALGSFYPGAIWSLTGITHLTVLHDHTYD